MIDRTEKEIMQRWKGDLSKPLVSICTITYNHENFIEEALDSFLMQETDFPFEIVIDDDASPDHTADIIKKYIEKYPRIFNARLRDKNVGSMTNFIENMQRANGEYIALCEGDDYWTDPLKLQKQVDFFKQNDNIDIVHSDFDVLDMKTGNILKYNYRNRGIYFKKIYHRNILLKDGLMRTMTVCFKKKMLNGITEHIQNQWSIADFPTFLYITRINENIGFISDSTGVYRRNINSASAFTSGDKAYDFYKNLAPIRFYFYDFFKIKNQDIYNYIEKDTHNKQFLYSVKALNRPFAFKSLFYKVKNQEFTYYDFKLIVMYVIKKMKLYLVSK